MSEETETKQETTEVTQEKGADGPLPPLAGTKPVFINPSAMEKYQLKTGEGVRDTVPFKLFNYQESMDEVQKIGFYSIFHEFRDELQVRTVSSFSSSLKYFSEIHGGRDFGCG
jgi:hypothetical protein